MWGWVVATCALALLFLAPAGYAASGDDCEDEGAKHDAGGQKDVACPRIHDAVESEVSEATQEPPRARCSAATALA